MLTHSAEIILRLDSEQGQPKEDAECNKSDVVPVC